MERKELWGKGNSTCLIASLVLRVTLNPLARQTRAPGNLPEDTLLPALGKMKKTTHLIKKMI